MSPTPPSSNASSAGHSPDTQYKVVRKRNRVPLSCGPCRHRKLKCNRNNPCDNCTKRGDVDNCTYAAPSVRKKNQTIQGATASPDDMQNRIDRLEGLVLALMTNGPQAAGPAAAAAAIAGSAINNNDMPGSISAGSQDPALAMDSGDPIEEEQEGGDEEVVHVIKSMGIMKVQPDGKSFFASEAHWFAILGEISEVKNYFAEHRKQFEEHYRRVKAQGQEEERPGTSVLFRAYNRLTHNEVMQHFPPKHVADLLITRYFNSYYPALHIVHGPTFQREYDGHWNNPSETKLMWYGLAFSMMALALQSYQAAGDEPPEFRGRTYEMSKDYRRLTAQTLVEGDIMGLPRYTLETFILHIQAEYQRSRDAEFGIQLSAAVLVRLATRMGYHRDSRSFPNISPFQGEMRRRVWAIVRQFDLLFSFQSGLSPMIRPGDANVELPANVYDDEIYEDMRQVPPSRPDTEVTPAIFMIAKTRAVVLFADIIETTQTFKGCSYEEIMRLDQRLRELHASVPPHLQMRSMEESARDTSSLIMQRYHLDLLFLRSQVVLHRKFLVPSRNNPRFSYSRRTCIDASMTMLQHQASLHAESRPGGRLRSVKWFTSSLTTNEFLLAGMIICLDLYHTAEGERSGNARRGASAEPYDAGCQERRAAMLAAIEQSLAIWMDIKDHSMEAFKAQGTLSVMIGKLKEHQQLHQAAQAYPITSASNGTYMSAATSSGPSPHNNHSPFSTEDANMAPEQSAAMTLGMLSTGAPTPNAANNMFGAGTHHHHHHHHLAALDAPPATTTLGASPGPATTPYWTGSSSEAREPAAASVFNAASPFSAMFAGVAAGGHGPLGFASMDMAADWDSWDSYVGGDAAQDLIMDGAAASGIDLMVELPTGDPAAAAAAASASAFAAVGMGAQASFLAGAAQRDAKAGLGARF